MALILPFAGKTPRIGRDVFLAPNATIIGDVEIADGASVWFGAVIRGDIGRIRIGPRTNVQDLACVHLTEGLSETILGADITVGHGAILHGCVVGDRCLIGMGSILLDNAQIGEGSVIAAGSVVSPRTVIPPRSLARGTPAKVIREVTEKEARLGIDGAEHYLANARRFRAICADLREVPPAQLADLERDRSAALAPAPPIGQARMAHGRERERALDFGNDRGEGED
jgi:carbonic anhydrase/acetyltransferase-like protein (isoleucine patch superfamily)